MTRCFFLFESYCPVHMGSPLWREFGSVTCWILWSTKLFVASMVFKIIPRHGPHGKHCLSVVKNECLLARYIAMDICELHRKFLLRHWFYCRVFVFRALPRKWSTYHNIIVFRHPTTLVDQCNMPVYQYCLQYSFTDYWSNHHLVHSRYVSDTQSHHQIYVSICVNCHTV
jgi:hypothetical protein